MTLPSTVGGATTAQLGYFDAAAPALADWIASGFDDVWRVSDAPITSLDDAVALLARSHELTRYLCVPVGRWTALLSNGPLGTDVGVLPSYAARELRCKAMRVVSFDDSATFPARVLEVYGPDGPPPLAMERSIAVANDGGRWIFETAGSAYPFEDQAAYAKRSKAARFTEDMLHSYLRDLGVPMSDEPDWATAVLVEHATP